MTRRLLLSVLIVLVVPGVARASTFCVGSVACPPGGIAKPGNAAGLQSALSDAAVNNQPDQALIGSGTYVALGVQGFTYSDAEALDITGSGSGSTIIQGSAGASSSAMALSGGASASVLEGVTVRMAAASGLGRGLDVQSWTVRGVSIDALPGAASSGTGVVMGGNAFVESSAVEPSPEFFRGIDAFGPNNVIRGCSVSAPVAIGAAQAAAEIDVARCRVNASRAGISVGGNAASGEVTNSLIRVTESASLEHALHAFTGATLSASNVTLIGSGGPDAGGLTEQANPGTASLSVSSSVVRGFVNSFRAAQSGGGTALATVNWSSWDTPSLETGGGNVDEGASNLGPGLAPGFLDAATGDYRLRFDSPLVDAGAAGPGVGPDLSGAIRFVDGAPPFTGPRRDIGAFEYQRAAPDAVASGPATGMIGESLPFTAQSSSDPDPGETLTYV
jgi:hypothetical protein